ncbi:MAG: Fic family protein [Chlamydiales bacterium]|nr:Fic family protein [Chlamydiales bacterium]
MSHNVSKAYNDLPPLPPKCDLESPSILKGVIEAQRELAELKAVGLMLPNLGVLIQAIALQEAKVSSEIENVVTTNDALFQSVADEGKSGDPYTKEVYRYHEALWFGFEAITQKKRLLSSHLFEQIAEKITGNQGGIRKLPGTQLKSATGKVIYIPPEGEGVIREHLEHLVHFIYQESRFDPLVRMALVHYQFEAIHPFYDGNGRTGRILNLLHLVHEKILEYPILYLSHYIIDHRSHYYAALNSVTTSGSWEAWVLYMLRAVAETARGTKQRIVAILKLMKETEKKIPRKIYSEELLEMLFEHPYCKIKFLARKWHRQTAAHYLRELEKAGILTCVKKGRELYYIFDDYIKLLS